MDIEKIGKLLAGVKRLQKIDLWDHSRDDLDQHQARCLQLSQQALELWASDRESRSTEELQERLLDEKLRIQDFIEHDEKGAFDPSSLRNKWRSEFREELEQKRRERREREGPSRRSWRPPIEKTAQEARIDELLEFDDEHVADQ